MPKVIFVLENTKQNQLENMALTLSQYFSGLFSFVF